MGRLKVNPKNTTRLVWVSANLLGFELLKECIKLKKVKVIAIITLSRNAKTKMHDGINRKKWQEFKVPVYEINNINHESKLLKSLKTDIVIYCGWRQIVSSNIIKLPQIASIGFHPTLLPQHRGPAPIINTILQGLEKSGVTMFILSKEIDAGKIIGQISFNVTKNDYAIDIYQKIIKTGKKLIKIYLDGFLKQKLKPIAQKKSEASFFPRVSQKDNRIDLNNDSPESIGKKIRAFSKPYKGAFIETKKIKLIIWKGEVKDQ